MKSIINYIKESKSDRITAAEVLNIMQEFKTGPMRWLFILTDSIIIAVDEIAEYFGYSIEDVQEGFDIPSDDLDLTGAAGLFMTPEKQITDKIKSAKLCNWVDYKDDDKTWYVYKVY